MAVIRSHDVTALWAESRITLVGTSYTTSAKSMLQRSPVHTQPMQQIPRGMCEAATMDAQVLG